MSFGIERLLSVPGLGAPPQPRVVWVGYAAEDQRLPALRAVAALRAGGAEVLFADGLEAAPSPRATVIGTGVVWEASEEVIGGIRESLDMPA